MNATPRRPCHGHVTPFTRQRDLVITEVPWWRRRESNPDESPPENDRSDANPRQSDACAAGDGGETLCAEPEPRGVDDAVEVALAKALTAATAAERWDVVGQLARELQARRLARTENVVVLSERRRDGGA